MFSQTLPSDALDSDCLSVLSCSIVLLAFLLLQNMRVSNQCCAQSLHSFLCATFLVLVRHQFIGVAHQFASCLLLQALPVVLRWKSPSLLKAICVSFLSQVTRHVLPRLNGRLNCE